jgi:hypothetical protein
MERRSDERVPDSRRLEKLAGETLVDIRKLSARAEQLLRCLRGASDLTGRDRLDRSDKESGWRLAA